ncbi:nucleotidyltransferase domain-containing protein [Shewanella sp.]|uniref:nucleotidyltransferase domain-containing protein n=1 Tax=Shewanella sp. TaxID=50422 RepID=UPI003A982731
MEQVNSTALTQAIAAPIRQEIWQRIAAAEREHDVKVLYAVESGSRAWGFASPNSDYDVRFVYAHKPEWYLSVDLADKRDVIEYPIVDEIDINGWDVRKALQLFRKSNPAIVEWLQSPLVYGDDGQFAASLQPLLTCGYSLNKGIFHYLNMAKTNYRGYLKGSEVRLKKYFYVLRPLLAVRWLLSHRSVAPIEFAKLLTMLTEVEVKQEVEKLLAVKMGSDELQTGPQVQVLNQFIEAELAYYENFTPLAEDNRVDVSELNGIFRQLITSAV